MLGDPRDERHRWASRDLTRIEWLDGNVLLLDGGGGQPRVVPNELAVLAGALRDFATLRDHARRVATDNRLDARRSALVLDALTRAATNGLLVREDRVIARLRTGVIGPRPPRATILGVPTHHRVEALQRVVERNVEQLEARTCDLVVTDDGTDRSILSRTRRFLATAARRGSYTILYADNHTKRAYARELSRLTGVSLKTIGFALLDPLRIGLTTGANRNALLLHAAGRVMASIDDDTLGDPLPVPDQAGGLAIRAEDPTEVWPHDGDDLLPNRSGSASVLALHELMIGRTVAQCVRDLGPSVSLSGSTPELRRRVLASRARIVATWLGFRGHPGLGKAHRYLLTRTGPSRERVLEHAAAIVERGECVRGVTRPTIGDGAGWTSGAVALDCRELLPPFFPVGRGQDLVFAASLRWCLPNALVGYLPWTVGHRHVASRRRGYRGDIVLAQLVAAWMASFPPPPSPCASERIRALGRRYIEVASTPPADLHELLRAKILEQRGGEAIHLRQLLETYGRSPPEWAASIERSLVQLANARVSIEPADIRHRARSPAASLDLTRDLLARFGELLLAWPDLVAGAVELRSSRELTLAKPV